MVDDFAAMLELSDAIQEGYDEVWDRRQPPVAPSGAAFLPPRASREVKMRSVTAGDSVDYVGHLVWSGQNLMCKVEEGGWRATNQLLEDVLQVAWMVVSVVI